MRAWLAGLVASLVAFAGCAGSGGTPASATPTSGATTAVQASNETGDVGTITGTVTDDELQPIAGAQVGLLRLDVDVETDAAGKFTFQNVPVGKHDLIAQRLGYEAAAKKVEVVAGQETAVSLVLVPLAAVEPYFESVQRISNHVVGETYVTFGINLTGLSPTCESCVWVIHLAKHPTFILWEVFGQHTVPSPQGDKEHYWFFNKGNGPGPLINERELPLPARMVSNDTQIKGMDKDRILWFQLLCENFWFCLQEKRESWITFFYDTEEFPEEFTAKPE